MTRLGFLLSLNDNFDGFYMKEKVNLKQEFAERKGASAESFDYIWTPEIDKINHKYTMSVVLGMAAIAILTAWLLSLLMVLGG